MNQYRSNQKQRTQINKKTESNQSTPRTRHPKSRFAQARLLVLVTRQIFNAKVSSILDELRIAPKRRYKILNIFDIIFQCKIKQSFMQILRYGKHHALAEIQTVTKRVNIKIFLCRSLDKLYNKLIKSTFQMIQTKQQLDRINFLRLDLHFNNNDNAIKKFNNKLTLRKINLLNQKRKLASINIIPVFLTISNIYIKNLKQSFHKIVLLSSHQMYEQKFNESQNQRKIFYDSQNKKSDFMAKQRQNLHQLKITIDNFTYERSTKLGEMKRQKAIKMNQVQVNIRNLQRQYEKSQIQLSGLQRKLQKSNLVIQKKSKFRVNSKGAADKVHNLFNSIKYEPKDENQLRSSSFINRIQLIKQKFKQIILINLESFKAQSQDYQVYLNSIKRNLICVYENVPLDSIKLSQQYALAQQENTGLKQLLYSLIFYDLLKNKGDELLKSNSEELEQLFQNIFRFVEQQENGQKQQQLRDSFISYKSTKSLKKKSSIKTSVISTKSVK